MLEHKDNALFNTDTARFLRPTWALVDIASKKNDTMNTNIQSQKPWYHKGTAATATAAAASIKQIESRIRMEQQLDDFIFNDVKPVENIPDAIATSTVTWYVNNQTDMNIIRKPLRNLFD
ncbi:MAG: hypothetical protein ACYCOU_25195 [Sulfobacillus sp.]